MKILVVGFVAFLSWSVLSTYIYVCRIKGFCSETVSIEMISIKPKEIISVDSLIKTPELKLPEKPDDLIVFFAFDKSDIKPDSSLEKYIIKSDLYLNHDLLTRIHITGYTDAVGSDEYNLLLGTRRASSLRKYFEDKGIRSDKLTIESMGEKDPVRDNNSISGRAGNRRAIITFKN